MMLTMGDTYLYRMFWTRASTTFLTFLMAARRSSASSFSCFRLALDFLDRLFNNCRIWANLAFSSANCSSKASLDNCSFTSAVDPLLSSALSVAPDAPGTTIVANGRPWAYPEFAGGTPTGAVSMLWQICRGERTWGITFLECYMVHSRKWTSIETLNGQQSRLRACPSIKHAPFWAWAMMQGTRGDPVWNSHPENAALHIRWKSPFKLTSIDCVVTHTASRDADYIVRHKIVTDTLYNSQNKAKKWSEYIPEQYGRLCLHRQLALRAAAGKINAFAAPPSVFYSNYG